MMFTRMLSAAVAGIVVTAGLFYLMHYLIEVSHGTPRDPRPRLELAFLPTIDDTPVVTNLVPPERPDPPPELPPGKPPIEDNGDVIAVPPPPEVPRPGTKGLRSGTIRYADGGLMTIVAVQPVYPRIASERGLEGQVVVRFDVSETGTVSNAVVVESSNRVFDKAAIDAAKRFRFKPRVVDGVPQASYGVHRLFTFRMESE